MKPVLVGDFAKWLGGRPIGFCPGDQITGFALDSNSVRSGDLFLAIKGERVDGHDFITQALECGAIGSIAERPAPLPTIQVVNLVDSLAKMASHFRTQFSGPVIGITGSAGKTTTKEFIASALGSLGPVLKTIGNRNTEYTVPLLWTDLEPEHRTVVVEMSMRGFGQVKQLATFSKPSIGLITNIGFAHMLMVGSRQGIADAKGELLDLLPNEGTAVLWHEDDFLESLKSKTDARIQTFGANPGADCQILDYKPLSWSESSVSGVCHRVPWTAVLPAVGRHIALNAAAAVLVAAELGIDPVVAASGLKDSVLPPMRMEVVERGGAKILLDTYNASPPSMIAAIETLAELPVEGRRLAVIGEMKELGEYTEAAHRSVGQSVANSTIEHVLFYGPATSSAIDEAIKFGMKEKSISSAESLVDVKRFLSKMHPGDAVLVKGSRSLELERALDMEDSH